MKKYNLSHGLLLPDAMLAATAMVHDYSLWTFNSRDFSFIKGLNLFTASEA
jgi:predicted nucleic acid-binding protein